MIDILGYLLIFSKIDRCKLRNYSHDYGSARNA